jgi:EcsC protein family
MNPPGSPKMSDEDVEALRRAKNALENPGLAAKLSNLLGLPIEAAMKSLPTKWSAVIHRATEKSLMIALETALATVDGRHKLPAQNRVNQVAVAAAGAVGGLFGLPALAIELPVSTTVMLRSIADIARSEGEDLRTIEAKLACIQVFALGGRSGSDDASESAYFAVRAALAKAVEDAAKHFAARGGARSGAPLVVRLITQIASRFGVIVSQKAAAQAVPIIGAAGGAAINVIFISHFQAMASGHFTVRRLERQYGAELARSTYQQL